MLLKHQVGVQVHAGGPHDLAAQEKRRDKTVVALGGIGSRVGMPSLSPVLSGGRLRGILLLMGNSEVEEAGG